MQKVHHPHKIGGDVRFAMLFRARTKKMENALREHLWKAYLEFMERWGK